MTPEEKLKDLLAQAEFHNKEYLRLKKEWEDNKPKSKYWADDWWKNLSLSQIVEFETDPNGERKKKSDYLDRLIGENSEPEFHLRKFEKLVAEIYELRKKIYENSLDKD
jgi:hypothetical protein